MSDPASTSPDPLLDPARLAALERLGLLDASPEPAFDRVTALVRRVIGVPGATVTFVGKDRQVYKSLSGLTGPYAEARETPLSHALCQYVVRGNAPLEFPDASADPRFARHPAVTDLNIVAFLSVPVRDASGCVLGTLCATDSRPRTWTHDDRATMADLAAVVESEIALRAEAEARTQAVWAVHESEEQFRLLTETATDLILTMTAEGEIVYVNAASETVLGYAPEALVGQPVTRLIPERMRAGHAAGIARYLATGDKKLSWDRVEVPMQRADGAEIPVAIAFSEFARDGQAFFTAIVRDMSAEKEADAKLREHEAEFRRIAESLPQLVWTGEPDGSVSYANARLTDYMGAPVEGLNLGLGAHPDDWPACAAIIQDSLATGTPYETECRLKRASDGVYRWHIVRAEPVHGDGPARWFGTCTDVHDLREARDRLRESGERLRLVQLATDDVVWDMDVASGHIEWSASGGPRLGWDDLSDGTDVAWWSSRIHAEDRARVEQSFHDFVGGDSDTWKETYRFRRADGTYAFIVDCGHLSRDNGGTPVRAVGAMMDLSERKALEDELVEAREGAETAARLKSALLANMSHEIRTPLTAVLGYAEILADEAPDDLRGYADTIRRGGERLLSTLNSVLDLAQIEGGTYTIACEPVDVLAEAHAACDALRPLASAKDISLTVSGTVAVALADRATMAMADRAGVGRILNNLVGNAIKFTTAGQVSLVVGTDGGQVVLDVSDTGVGISDAFLPRLFDEFRQESEGDSRAHEGNGLGLAITRRLVEMMDGEITAQSELGAGSTFTVRLPASTEAPVPRATVPSAEAPRHRAPVAA